MKIVKNPTKKACIAKMERLKSALKNKKIKYTTKERKEIQDYIDALDILKDIRRR